MLSLALDAFSDMIDLRSVRIEFTARIPEFKALDVIARSIEPEMQTACLVHTHVNG